MPYGPAYPEHPQAPETPIRVGVERPPLVDGAALPIPESAAPKIEEAQQFIRGAEIALVREVQPDTTQLLVIEERKPMNALFSLAIQNPQSESDLQRLARRAAGKDEAFRA